MIKSYIANISEKLLGSFSSLKFGRLDLANIWIEIGLLLLMVLLLSFLINLILSHTILGKNYRLFVAPGVILHELSHALFCLLTGAKISKISLFDKDGGSVTHERSKIPVLGPVLIAFAPLAFGITAIFLIANRIGFSAPDFNIFQADYNSLSHFLKQTIGSLETKSYLNLGLLYLVFSFAVTMTPSRQDIKNSILSLFIFLVAIAGTVKFAPNWISSLVSHLPAERFSVVLVVAVLLLIFALVFSIIVYIIGRLFRR